MNEPLDLDLVELKEGDLITIDLRVRKAFEDEIDLETPDGTDNVVFIMDSFKSCNARLTDQSPDAGKTIDHISDPQDMVKPPEIEGVRIAREKRARDEWIANLARDLIIHRGLTPPTAIEMAFRASVELSMTHQDVGKIYAEVE